METRHPHLTTQKSFYVEISRARDRAELVTDDAAELRAQLQAVTGERIAEMEREASDKGVEAEPGSGGKEPADHGPSSKDREPAAPIRERGAGMDLGL